MGEKYGTFSQFFQQFVRRVTKLHDHFGDKLVYVTSVFCDNRESIVLGLLSMKKHNITIL